MALHERSSTLRKDLRLIWIDGLVWSAMVGLGESYLQAFALAIGMPTVWVGWVATLPVVVGAALQLVSPFVVRRIGSHRRWVTICAAVQAGSFVPLVVGAAFGGLPWPWLFVCASLYWAGGLGSAPAWSTWVETLVPARVRIRYFSRRNRFLYAVQIAGLFCAGWLLDLGEVLGKPLLAFALVFGLAWIARGFSARCLAAQSEPTPLPSGMRDVSLAQLVRRFRNGSDGRLIVYMLAVQFALQTAQPFFAPFVLEVIELDYARFMALLVAPVLAKFALLPWLGRVAERHGVRALLWVGGVALLPSASFWMLSTDWRWLFVAQLWGGAALAAYELATLLLFFEAIPNGERTSVLTTYYMLHALALAAGSLLGGCVLESLGTHRDTFLLVFGLSSLLRIATLPFLRRVARAPGRMLAQSA